MNYEELEQLFYSGELEHFIQEGEEYLLDNPKDTDMLFLMAVAHHDKAYENGHEEVYEAIQDYVIPYLRRVLVFEPDNARILYNILNYPLSNQITLEQIARPKYHLNPTNINEFIDYAERLKRDVDNSIFGHDFLIKIYEFNQNEAALVKCVDDAIVYFRERFNESRDLKDRNISICWLKKIYSLDRTKSWSQEELIREIDSMMYSYISPNDEEFMDLAEIAFEGGNLDVSLKALLKLIKGNNHSKEIEDGFVFWHERFQEQIKIGYKNPDVFYFQLIIERNYFEILNLEEDFYYKHALEIIKVHPENFAAYHFAGTYLYDIGNFEEAYVFLKHAVELNPDVTTWRRMLESEFLSYGTITQNIPVFNSLPRDLYNEAVNLESFLKNMLDDGVKEALRTVDLKLYQQSYNNFRRYFEENAFESDFYGDEHCWAMCCNNYAIGLIAHGKYEEAIEIATEGMNYSEFSELNHTLIEALLKNEDYHAAQDALEDYFSMYDDSTAGSYYKHLQHKADLVTIKHKLGKSEDIVDESQVLLFQIYEHYQDNPDISDYDFRDFEAAKNTIEEILYKEYEHKTIEERKAYYEGIAAKYPDEANPQYNLMQVYNELEDFEHVNKAARLYMENKQSFLLNDFDKAKTLYMIVKSHFFLGEHREGAAMFSDYDDFCFNALDKSEYVLWISYGIKLYDQLNDFLKIEELLSRFQEIYNSEGWSYDEISEGIHLIKAHSLYKQGNLKEAHKALDYVLSYDNYDAKAEHYKQTWKKPSLFSKFGF